VGPDVANMDGVVAHHQRQPEPGVQHPNMNNSSYTASSRAFSRFSADGTMQ
jgi:hypothetical protein